MLQIWEIQVKVSILLWNFGWLILVVDPSTLADLGRFQWGILLLVLLILCYLLNWNLHCNFRDRLHCLLLTNLLWLLVIIIRSRLIGLLRFRLILRLVVAAVLLETIGTWSLIVCLWLRVFKAWVVFLFFSTRYSLLIWLILLLYSWISTLDACLLLHMSASYWDCHSSRWLIWSSRWIRNWRCSCHSDQWLAQIADIWACQEEYSPPYFNGWLKH